MPVSSSMRPSGSTDRVNVFLVLRNAIIGIVVLVVAAAAQAQTNLGIIKRLSDAAKKREDEELVEVVKRLSNVRSRMKLSHR
jgi:hypothetical protein